MITLFEFLNLSKCSIVIRFDIIISFVNVLIFFFETRKHLRGYVVLIMCTRVIKLLNYNL